MDYTCYFEELNHLLEDCVREPPRTQAHLAPRDCCNKTMAPDVVYEQSDEIELCAAQSLYLKPIQRLTIRVMLPELQDAALTFSNQDLIDKLKHTVSPDQFSDIKVSEITKEFIRLEGETDTKRLSQAFLAKLHGSVIKLNGVKEDLSLEVTEAQIDVPSQQDWGSSLRATKELKEIEEFQEGQKQDISSSLYLEGLPCQWFLPADCNGVKPSVDVLKIVFETFGTVKNIDIPMLVSCGVEEPAEDCEDATLGPLHTFEVFIQYEDPRSLVKAMESLEGMQLMFKGEDGKHVPCNMKVMIDTTNHFSEEVISQGNLERPEVLEQEQNVDQKEEKDERKREDEERKAYEETEETQKDCKAQKECEQEEKTSENECQTDMEDLWIDDTAEWEERKLLLAHRRVESMKLLTILLEKVQEHIILDNFSKELLLNFDADKDSCQSTEDESVKNAERIPEIQEIVLSDELDWEEHFKIHSPAEKNDSNYTGEADEEDKDNEEKGDEDKEDKSYLSISSPVSSYDLSITTSSEDLERQSPERILTKVGKRKRSYKCGSLQMAMHKINEQKETQIGRGNWRTYRGFDSRDTNEAVCYKKPKIYETDEFIHYLLNYYEYPSYARICLEQNNTESKSWWQRVVFNNGNGFQISLMNLCGQPYTKKKSAPGLKQLAPKQKSCSEWSMTVQNTETPVSNKSCPKLTKDLPMKWAHTENKLESVNQRNSPFKNINVTPLRSYKIRPKKTQIFYQPPAEANELKDVLEKISSDSEYFSEELEKFESKPKRVCKEDCRVECKKVPIKKRNICLKKRRVSTFTNTGKDESNDSEDMLTGFGLQFSDMSSNLKTHCRCKHMQKCKKPNSILQSEEQNSESESTDDEAVTQGNINGKKTRGNCSEGGSCCCSDNCYQNHLCNRQKDSWKRAYLQRVIERSKRTQHKAKLKLTPHLCGAADYPFQMCHRGLQRSVMQHANQQDTSACGATCKHCEEPSYEYSSDICECQDQPLVRKSLKNIKPSTFCPKNFHDYLQWQRYFNADGGFGSIR